MLKKISLAVCTLVSTLVLLSSTVMASDSTYVFSKSDLYDTVKNAVLSHRERIEITIDDFRITENEVVDILYKATDLNYQRTSSNINTAWCDGFSVNWTKNSNGYIISLTVKPQYNATVKEDEAADHFCKKWVGIYLEDVDDDFEKVEIMHDWLVQNIAYTPSLDSNGQYIYRNAITGILDGVGVCVSYATIFQKMCNYAGIECVTYYDSIPGGRHAWNYVNIDGYWYGVDATYDDPDNGNRVNYDYFLTTKGHLGKNAPSGIKVHSYY